MKLPTRDFLIVKQLSEQEQTQSGLYIPDNIQEKPNEGLIDRLGEECNPKYKEGMWVLFKKGNFLKLEDNFILIQESDILMYDNEIATA